LTTVELKWSLRRCVVRSEKKRAADQASEVMGRLKRVLLREQFVKLFQLVRSYKAKTVSEESRLAVAHLVLLRLSQGPTFIFWFTISLFH
jgi:hypothetical protein